MNKIKKKGISVLLMVLIAIGAPMFSGEQKAYAKAAIEQTCEIYHPGGQMDIRVKSTPDTLVGIEVLRPQQETDFPPANGKDLMQMFSYVCQLETDADGLAYTTIKLDDECGTYTVRASNATHISVTVPGEFFALSWDSDYFDPRVYPYYLLTKDKLDRLGFEAVAEEARAFLRGYPEGRRAIMIHSDLSYLLHNNAEDFIWWDWGCEELTGYIESFFKAFKEAGGEVDIVRSDHEVTMDLFSLRSKPVDADESWNALTERFEKIVANERYKTEIRPLLEKRGFVFPEDPNKCELYDVRHYDIRNVMNGGNINGLIWNSVMGGRRANYLNQAMFEPVRKYFPEASYSNSGNSKSAAWFAMTDGYGHRGYLAGGGVGTGVGTHSTFPMFGNLQSIQEYPPEGYSGKIFDNTPFNGLLYYNNKARAAILSTTDGKFQPSIGRYDYVYHAGYQDDAAGEEKGAATFGSTPYWHENMIHVALCNPDPILYFGLYGDGILTDSEEQVMEQGKIFSDLLSEINAMVGTPDRRTLVDNITSWDSKYILSGMYAGGHNIWRITPDLTDGEVTIQSFCTNEEIPTFSIGNETISFPGGEIVSYEGSEAIYGYWIKTPQDTKPVISYDTTGMETKPFAAELALYRYGDGILMTDDVMPENGGIAGKLSYKNVSGEDQPVTVIAVQYEGNRLLGATILAQETIPNGATGNLICKLSEFNPHATSIKFLLWEDTTTLKPVAGSRTLENGEEN